MSYTTFSTPSIGGGFSNVDGERTKAGDVLVHVESDDIEADLKRATEAGGTLVAPEMEIPGVGWIGLFRDPWGNTMALLKLMERTDLSQMQLIPGAIQVVQLPVDNRHEGTQFYQRLFGWEPTHYDAHDYSTLATGSIDGGMNSVQSPTNKRGEALVHVLSTDVQADLEKAVSLGAQAVMPKTEIPGGAFSIFADPTGNRVALISWE
jgi:predicted enzyme related to lactoylglutathione lyase